MNRRRIGFEKIQNARDLGGLRTEDGHTIASGLLFRSANLAEATEADMRALQEKYRLSKIIDLRTEMERRQKPDAVMKNVTYLPIPVFDERMAGISHERDLEIDQIKAVIPKMETLYRTMVTRESCKRNLGIAARNVMEHDYTQGSVLWHCTEGKDRCGLLTMILLSALHVDRCQVMEDYLLTNEVNGPKAEMYYQQTIEAGGTEAEAAVMRSVFLAKEAYLNEAFSAIDEQYPDMDTFLQEGLHIPRGDIDRFQKSVLR